MKPQLFGAPGDVQACEERLMNCWPSHQSVVMGDWLCRFAAGYSGRANSACVTRPEAVLDEATLEAAEELYRRAGLRPSFRLSPLVGEAARARLEARGYAPEDGSIGMIGPVRDSGLPAALMCEAAPSQAWLEGACRWQSGPKRDIAALAGIVANIRVPACYLILRHEGREAAYALLALDRGMVEMGSVMVDPALRGKGLGRVLVSGALSWAARAGARRLFLQVATENAVARSLYASLGLADLYTAAYWREQDRSA